MLAQALPQPQQLAELGAVLCLWRMHAGSDLAGWSQAVRASYGCELDSAGLREQVWFFDASGACCWRLCLLPDTDFLAWDRLVNGLPWQPDRRDVPGLAERLWRHLSRHLLEPDWRACVLRFHVRGAPVEVAGALAASLPALSPLGCEQARRIVRDEGIDGVCWQGVQPCAARMQTCSNE